MNKLLTSIPVVFLSMFLFSGSVAAVPPEHANAHTPSKSTILHCGCNIGGTDLIYLEKSVSSKTRGHDQHMVGQIESCGTGIFDADVEETADFVRLGADCQIDGPALGDPISACVICETCIVAGDTCGGEVIPE